MKTIQIAALAAALGTLVLVGAGCSKSGQPSPTGQNVAPPNQANAYPGTEPYVAPQAPPPGVQPQ